MITDIDLKRKNENTRILCIRLLQAQNIPCSLTIEGISGIIGHRIRDYPLAHKNVEALIFQSLAGDARKFLASASRFLK